jgi:putative ATP-dependent endonuclease of OLD family
MYLKNITIKNFRSIVETSADFHSGLNLIVGPNDSGKTAIIDAVRLTLKQVVDDYARFSFADFNDPSKPVSFELTFAFDEDDDEDRITAETSQFAEYLTLSDDSQYLNVWFQIKSSDEEIRYPDFKVGPNKEVAVDMDAKCRHNLRVIYLRPLRDAEYELQARTGSRISKILKELKSIKASGPTLESFLDTFNNDSDSFFTSPTGGKKTTEEVKRLLESFDEQFKIKQKVLKFGTTNDPDYVKTLERISLYYDNVKNPGLGTRNMMFIAAELLHMQDSNIPKLILIEEVEAHLHPQRQLKIIKSLELESDKNRVQLLMTSHSPNLSSAVSVERLGVFSEGKYLSLAKGKTELSDDNYKYLGRFLDATKANLFFAQGVILVEGTTELLLIPEFAKLLNTDLTSHGVSVISTQGLGFNHFSNIFKRLGDDKNKIPVAVVTDADKKTPAEIAEYSRVNSDEDNNVAYFVGDQLFEANEDGIIELSSTFEKMIIENTVVLKQLYIDAYNSRRQQERAMVNMETLDTDLYKKFKDEKAPLAQIVAVSIAELEGDQKVLAKTEIEEHLTYIKDACEFSVSTEPEEIEEA